MSNIFFTADEHHGHANIIKFCNRPFTSPQEMTEELVRRHNAVVKPGDVVYHLGDMFWRTFGRRAAVELMHRLKGTHYYIWGNHDELIQNEKSVEDCFVWLKERATISIPNRKDLPKIVLDHYAGRVWNKSHSGSWALFGHSHCELPSFGYSFDVGVDCWNYAPVSLEEVEAKMKLVQIREKVNAPAN